MSEPTTITRDELAAKMRISTRTLKRKERELGLLACKIKLNVRPALYRQTDAVSILRALGYPV